LAHSAATGRSIPIVSPAEGVSEALIRELVETFYGRVIRDPELGPIFHKALSGRWSQHLALMVDFWSSIALRTGRYQGKPQAAHFGLQLTPDLFTRWLSLFEKTAQEICEPDVAVFFVTVRGASRRACRSASESDRRRCVSPKADSAFPPFQLVVAAPREQGRNADHQKTAGHEHADEEFGIAKPGRNEAVEKSLHEYHPSCGRFGRTALNGRKSTRSGNCQIDEETHFQPPCHHRPHAGNPTCVEPGIFRIGMAGTRPAMAGRRCESAILSRIRQRVLL
jgi:hemoglobin